VTELLKSNREPFFLECEDRRLFSIFHSPGDRAAVHGGAVYFAPFTEEANRARRMASLLAENLSGTGVGTLLFDYSSAGDSSGEFSQARWDDWVSDGCAAIEWLHQKIGKPVALVGLRLGAAIALECAQKIGREFPHIVLWQPVTNGRTFFTQFLRIRLAASLADGGTRETTKDLMERLSDGETLEIAGYNVAPALADAVNGVNFGDLVPPPAAKIHWFEVTTGEDDALMPPSQNAVSRWREAGVDVAASVIAGEQFWATQEIATALPLIEATQTALAGPSA
jgi:exosortase A-associated hydrolase 2